MSVALGAHQRRRLRDPRRARRPGHLAHRQRDLEGAPERPRRGHGAGVLPQGGRGRGHPAEAARPRTRWPRPRRPDRGDHGEDQPRQPPGAAVRLRRPGRVEEGGRAPAARRRRGRVGASSRATLAGPGASRGRGRGGPGGRRARGRTQLRTVPADRVPQPRRQRADHVAVRMRFHPILHVWRLHSGTDFAVPAAPRCTPAADGTVISAGIRRRERQPHRHRPRHRQRRRPRVAPTTT